jgi:hypothetical protein
MEGVILVIVVSSFSVWLGFGIVLVIVAALLGVKQNSNLNKQQGGSKAHNHQPKEKRNKRNTQRDTQRDSRDSSKNNTKGTQCGLE